MRDTPASLPDFTCNLGDEPLGPVTLEAFPARLKLRAPMRLASEVITHAETLLVRARDAAAEEGWGEASSAPTMTGEVLPGMVAVVERHLAPALAAAAAERPVRALVHMMRSIRGNTGAKAAVEIAVLDLLARRAGMPLAAFLGRTLRNQAPAILMIGGSSVDAALAAARSGWEAGYRHLKLKVGLARPEEDAEAVLALRAALGPAAHLSADANMAWTVPQALEFARRLGPGQLDYLEQPVADDDWRGMAAVQAEIGFPLCVDEGLHGLEDIDRAAAAGAARGVGLKAIKLGGAIAVLRADARCVALGMAQTLACKISESSIGAATTAHLACLLNDVSWGVSITSGYLAEDPGQPLVVPAQGMVQPPPGPGLGVRPDPAWLASWS